MKMNNFEICLRAIIINRNKILLCHDLKNKHYFFPGGHLEFGERIFPALKRELKEELGIILYKLEFMGALDNIYQRKNNKHHEINLVFKAKVNQVHANSLENHISFKLVELNRLAKTPILPLPLKKAVIKWLKGKKIFWAGSL